MVHVGDCRDGESQRRRLAWATLAIALLLLLDPTALWAQGAGWSATAIQLTSLDSLLKTAGEHLMSGAVIPIMAAAFIIAGAAGMKRRR